MSETAPRVLVVDDEPLNRALIEAILAPEGYVVEQAGDGLDALERLAAGASDVVLLDVMMPRLDGFGTLERIRERWPTLPVVVVTALGDRSARIRAIELGADDVLVKPVDDVELTLRVRNLVRSARNHARAERARAVEASAREVARIYQQLAHGVILYDTDGRVIDANRAAAETLGVTPEQMRGHRIREMVQVVDMHGKPVPFGEGPSGRALSSGEPQCSPLHGVIRKDGSLRWLQVNSVPLLDENGNIERVVASQVDLTDRHTAEERLRAAYQSVAFAVVVLDNRGQVVEMNRSAEDILGASLSVVSGRRLSSLLTVHFADGSQPKSDSSVVPLGDTTARITRPDKQERWVRGDLRAIPNDPDGRMVASFIDVTEQRKMQDQLVLSDRLAAVGTMAAGVAHEINNPLGALLANLELAREVLTTPSPDLDTREMIADALTAGLRVRDVVRDLKALSRVSDEPVRPVAVHPIVESTLRMANNELRHRARVIKELYEVPQIDANESRLGQVLLNLIINAAQAIPGGAVGRNFVRIVTRAYPDKGRVLIEVSDSGSGIEPEVQKRMFDAFFSTKPVGVGTGLGLSISEGIVRSLGGEITFDSEVGIGSTFRVWLPISRTIPQRPTLEQADPGDKRASVLIVDDDRGVAEALARVLAERHRVTVCTRGAQALERLRTESFDLILCDVMMPEMTGMQLYEELHRRHPELLPRVVFMTGGAFTQTARQFLAGIPNTQLEKPIAMQTLRALIGRLTPELSKT
jgi:PAS domain S-box-containing protein